MAKRMFVREASISTQEVLAATEVVANKVSKLGKVLVPYLTLK